MLYNDPINNQYEDKSQTRHLGHNLI